MHPTDELDLHEEWKEACRQGYDDDYPEAKWIVGPTHLEERAKNHQGTVDRLLIHVHQLHACGRPVDLEDVALMGMSLAHRDATLTAAGLTPQALHDEWTPDDTPPQPQDYCPIHHPG